MNIAFLKLGKSIKFKGNYSPIGGDNESPQLFSALVNNNPNDTFYIIGKSDFKKLSEFEKLDLYKYDNIIDVMGNCPYKLDKRNKYEDHYIQYLINYFKDNNIKIDAIVCMVGQVGTVTIPEKIRQVKNPKLFASIIDMTSNYTSPMTVWLNSIKDDNIPIIEIINDPRYNLSQSRDLMFNPKKSLSQYNGFYKKENIRSYDNQVPLIENNIQFNYAEMEKIFLIDKQFPDNANNNRINKFTIILNEGKPSRYKLLKEWILDNSELQNCDIFGQWSSDIIENDKRFKGSISLNEVQQKMENTKYTFIIPIASGWVTSKYIEMIYAGCLPFLHPTYDAQKHIKEIPNILRPKNQKELSEAIKYFEDNDSERIKLIKQLQQQLITEDYTSGKKLSEIIYKAINE